MKIKNLSSLCDCDVYAAVKIMMEKYNKGKKEVVLPFMNVKMTVKELKNNEIEIKIIDI